MAETTGILWTQSTFNPFWGCTQVAPGCDNCYAKAVDARVGGLHWGIGSTPRVMSDSYWKQPLRWDKKASAAGVRHRVFSGSMCDWTDKNAPAGQLARLWDLIRATPNLDWQLLTKRAPNIRRCLPTDWGNGYDNVWLGVTVEDRKHGLPRIEHLRRVPAKIRFLSIEPLLEDLGEIDLNGIQWAICGGESGPSARPMAIEWVVSLRRQAAAAGVPFFFKQWGGRRDKGGCLLDGIEIKEWPAAA